MWKLSFATLGVAALLGASAHAQTAESLSQSTSQSGIYQEGSTIPNNTPGLGGLVGSAGNCYPGGGVQAVGPGFGVGVGGGRVDPECNVRMEMAALAAIAGNPVAIRHACKHDESMRATLVEAGLCRTAPTPTATRQGATEIPPGLLECSRSTIRVASHVGAAQQQAAIRWCKSRLK